MQSEIPGDSVGTTPTPGCGDDVACCLEAAASSRLAHEDDQDVDDQTAHEQIATRLHERDRSLQAAFDRAAVGIAVVSLQGRWLRFNQRLCDLLGYDCAELAAHTWQDVTFPDDRDASDAFLRRTLSGERDAYDIDKRYVRKDGALVWVHLTTSLVRTPQGEPDYFLSMVEDITTQKRLEQDRAHLLEQERAARLEAEAARAEAEATNARLRAMQALTDTALSHLALDDLLRELLGRVTDVMGVDNVSILLLDEDGRTLTVRAARGILEEEVGHVQIPVGRGFSGRIAANRAPLIVDDTSAFDFYKAHSLLREQLQAVVGVPLLVDEQVDGQVASRLVGVLHVGSATPRRFSEADVQLLQRVADRIALAIGRARLYAAEQDARQHAEVRGTHLHTILETIADGVVFCDAQGRPIQTNRAYRALLAADHLPGFDATTPTERGVLLDLRDSFTGIPLPPERIPTARALAGEVVTGPSADVRVRAFDGHTLEVNASAAPLRDPTDGRVVGAVLVLRDISAHKQLEREREAARASELAARTDELAAREASRRLEAFLATAAHDLRTPITATVGYIGLAQRRTERLAAVVAQEAWQEEHPDLARQVEAVYDQLEDADQSAARLARLLTLLFDTAAICAGKLELQLHRAPCDLAALVREQVAALRVAAPERTITFRILHASAGGEPIPVLPVIPVEVDADRIGQVVTNYVTNALKYAPPDQPVEVSVAAHGGRARVAVRDAGPGIPQAERARVWELFHRAPEVTVQGRIPDGASGQSGSLGLGLHISKAIVEAHGGRVGVTSAVRQGSTFWFTLPLALAEAHADAEADNHAEAHADVTTP